MTKLTESQIEDFAIELFQQLGYEYIYAPAIAPDVERGSDDKRDSFADVLLRKRLTSAIERINPTVDSTLLSFLPRSCNLAF